MKYDIPPQQAICIQENCGKEFYSGDEGGFNLRESPAQNFKMGWTCGVCYRLLCFSKSKKRPVNAKRMRRR